MIADQAEYEVQVLRNDRWSTEATRRGEAGAKQHANELLGDKKCAGVRVIGNTINRDGSITERVVFEQTQAVNGEKAIQINPVSVAEPHCNRPRDLFAMESRALFNRIFRSYLEEITLTPTEVMHNYREIQRLNDRDSLVQSAVSLVAKLQTAGTDQSLRDRQDEIYALLEQMEARAKAAENRELPPLRPLFSKTMAEVAGLDASNPDYLAMVVLARELSGINSWIGKLDKLCKLISVETGPQAILMLDTVIADVLGANVIQEILGWKRSLGSAIVSMLDLADGILEIDKSEAADMVKQLNQLFSNGALPVSRQVVVERALRQLRSKAPLYQADPAREMQEYQLVLARLLQPGSILAGAQAVEALTERSTQFVEQGGATGRKAAINATYKALPDPARGVMYLAELTNTGFAEAHMNDIIEQMDTVFSVRVIDDLCRHSKSRKDRMVSATGAYNVIETSTLPEAVKQQVTKHIDAVLERYLVDEDIINKLDKPQDHIRDRAVRLVKFCGAGVLPNGKALALARKRVVELLRQPNFDVHFVEDIDDPVRAENTIREFHKMLVQAGIG